MAQDDYSPIMQGDVGSPFNAIFVGKTTGLPLNLTGATITMKMQNIENPETVNVCTGTWTINSDPTTGQASYAYSSADVSIAGTWNLSIEIMIGGKPIHADVKILNILPLI